MFRVTRAVAGLLGRRIARLVDVGSVGSCLGRAQLAYNLTPTVTLGYIMSTATVSSTHHVAAIPTPTDRPWIGAVDDEFRMYSCVYHTHLLHPPLFAAAPALTIHFVLNSDNPNDYTLGRPIGFGASSIVYAATYHCPDTREDIDVALKVVDLDKLPQSALKLLTTETQLMSLSKHPNVLRVRGTWLEGRRLYIALRLMRAGSISDCMRYKFTTGIDEESIRSILKQALDGLK